MAWGKSRQVFGSSAEHHHAAMLGEALGVGVENT